MLIIIRTLIIIFNFFLVSLSSIPAYSTEKTTNYYLGSLKPYTLYKFLPDTIYVKPKKKVADRVIDLKNEKIFYDANKEFPHKGTITAIEIQIENSGEISFYLNDKKFHSDLYENGYNIIKNLSIPVDKGDLLGVGGTAKLKTFNNKAFEKKNDSLPIRLTVNINYLFDDINKYGFPIAENSQENITYFIEPFDKFDFNKNHHQIENFIFFKFFNLILPFLIVIIFYKYIFNSLRHKFITTILFFLAIIVYNQEVFVNTKLFFSNLSFFLAYLSLYKLSINKQYNHIATHGFTITCYTILILIITIVKLPYIYLNLLIFVVFSYLHKNKGLKYYNFKLKNYFFITSSILILSSIDIYFANFASIKFDGFEHLARSAEVFLNNFSFGEAGIAFTSNLRSFSNAYNFSPIPFYSQYIFFNKGVFDQINFYEFFTIFSILHYKIVFILISIISKKSFYISLAFFVIIMSIWNNLIFLPFMGFTDHSLLYYPTEFIASFLVPMIATGTLINLKSPNNFYIFILSLIILIGSIGHLQNLNLIAVFGLSFFIFTFLNKKTKTYFIVLCKTFILPTLFTILSLIIFQTIFEIPEIERSDPFYYSIYRDYPENTNFIEGQMRLINEYFTIISNNLWRGATLFLLICSFILFFIKKNLEFKWIITLCISILIFKLSFNIQNFIVPITSYRPFHALDINFQLLSLILLSSILGIIVHYILKIKLLFNYVKHIHFFIVSFLIYIISIVPFMLMPPKSGITFLDFLGNRYMYKDLQKNNCFHLDNDAAYAITGLSTAKAYYISKNYGGFLDFRKSHSICLKNETINCIPRQCLILD